MKKKIMKPELMLKAIEIAKNSDSDIPIGAVIVKDGEIISFAHNQREKDNIATYHAEILAIQRANEKLKNWRLNNCEMYVTLEPCPMCAGAIGWAQIPRIVFGAADEKRGYRAFAPNVLHPKAQVTAGILGDECAMLMKEFFKNRR